VQRLQLLHTQAWRTARTAPCQSLQELLLNFRYFSQHLRIMVHRYGALPVVRATGGLADTVFDVDSPSPPPQGQHPNGFTFAGADEAAEDSALERAFRCQCPVCQHFVSFMSLCTCTTIEAGSVLISVL
jgi:hypothetical protein